MAFKMKGFTPFTADLSRYSKKTLSKWSKNATRGGSGKISAPRHVQQARSAAMSNPVGALVEGVRVIGGGVRNLFRRNKA